MIIFLSLLVSIIGAVFYYVAKDAKIAELGRLAYACGLLAFLLKFGEPMINLLGGGGK